MASETFQVGDLTAVIGDNGAKDEHRAGYNGLWSLTHKAEPTNLFVPAVAGFNLEHIFDGQTIDFGKETKLFFEPRNAPMELKRLSDQGAELHQPPTPTFQLESWTAFTLRAPHYIDVDFRCRATQHVFERGYIGLFWASYINAPEDRGIYLRNKQGWQQFCTPVHNNQSTVVHEDNRFDLTFNPEHQDCLYKNLSPLKYSLPLFYGLFKNQTLLIMFDRTDGVRFSHSPSGGGYNAAEQTGNPAWDFQFVIPRYEVLKEYSFRSRLVYRPRCPRTEVLREYELWQASLSAPKGNPAR